MTTQIAEYSPTEAALAELANRYRGVVFDVRTKDGMKAAAKARAELRGYRTDLERKRVEIKGPALERCRLIDTEAKRIREAIEALEDPIVEQIEVEEARLAREKQEREARERARVDAIRDAMADVRALPASLAAAGSARIAESLAEAREMLAGGFAWAEEFADQAERELHATIATLETLETAARDRENQAAELARLRAEQEAREAAEREREAQERRRQAQAEAEARARIAAEEQAARKRIEAQEEAARFERLEQERVARAQREEAERKAQAERAEEARRLEAEREAQRQEADRIAREREALDAERRELEARAAELRDGRAVLQSFLARFGKRKEFAPIVAAIKQFLGLDP